MAGPASTPRTAGPSSLIVPLPVIVTMRWWRAAPAVVRFSARGGRGAHRDRLIRRRCVRGREIGLIEEPSAPLIDELPAAGQVLSSGLIDLGEGDGNGRGPGSRIEGGLARVDVDALNSGEALDDIDVRGEPGLHGRRPEGGRFREPMFRDQGIEADDGCHRVPGTVVLRTSSAGRS